MLPLLPCSRSSLLALPAGVRSLLRPQILTTARRYLADGMYRFLFHPHTTPPHVLGFSFWWIMGRSTAMSDVPVNIKYLFTTMNTGNSSVTWTP